MAEHVSSFPEDEDGWITVECTCGFVTGPIPDAETAADVWGDHQAEVILSQVGPKLERLELFERFLVAHDLLEHLRSELTEDSVIYNRAVDAMHDARHALRSTDPSPPIEEPT